MLTSFSFKNPNRLCYHRYSIPTLFPKVSPGLNSFGPVSDYTKYVVGEHKSEQTEDWSFVRGQGAACRAAGQQGTTAGAAYSQEYTGKGAAG